MKSGYVSKANEQWKLSFENKKGNESSIIISDSSLISWLGSNIKDPSTPSEVEFKLDGQPVKLKYGDKVFDKDKSSSGRSKKERRRKSNNSGKKIARAPYNFIPLNKEVAFTVQDDRYSSFDKYDPNKLSGHIDVSVENLTPLFIRQVSKDPENFKIGDQYGIPGSSMRGMTRTFCEILSYGKFGPYEDKRSYDRAIYHDDPHNKKYKNKLKAETYKKNGQWVTESGARAGYLNGSKITPAQTVDFKNGYKRDTSKDYDPDDQFTFCEENGKVRIQTGDSTKKKAHYLIDAPATTQNKLNVSNEILNRFKNDTDRAEEVNKYIDEAKNCSHGLPVFYMEENGQVLHFGHTPFYRIPFNLTVVDHIPKDLRKKKEFDKNQIDLVQGLFGESFKNNSIASRLSFSDLMTDENIDIYDTPELLKILASPKISTFQHYIEQPDYAKTPENDWNSKEANIRGFKLYWHRDTDENKKDDEGQFDLSWTEDEEDYNENVNPDPVKPIRPNARFSGKIWFQNLSETELGLLLEALEPSIEYDKEQNKVAHKIGLAKPLGLGSIKIALEDIHCLDIEHMYKDKNAKFIREGQCAPRMVKGDKEALKETFQKELLERLNDENTPGTIWELDRLKELREMMRFDPASVGEEDWLQKTRYMEIDKEEFSKRPILKKPTEVKKASMDSFVSYDKESK